jgi:type II secretory pathway component PulF
MKKVSNLIKSRPESILIVGFFVTVVILSVYNSIVHGMNDSPW